MTLFQALNDDQIKLLWIVGIVCLTLLVICSVYLVIFARKRSIAFGQMKKLDFVKETGILFKIGILLSFTDVITDYVYAFSLILRSNQQSIQFLGWLSLICGSIGTTLCIFHMVFARKIYSKIPGLKVKLQSVVNSNNNEMDDEIEHTLGEIRSRKVDIGVFAILIVCIEDIPQMAIIFLVNSMLSSWTEISIIALSMSIISCLMKFMTIMMDGCGCNDDTIQGIRASHYSHVQIQSTETIKRFNTK